MKPLRLVAVIVLVAVLLALGTMTVAADPPIVVAKNTVPFGAPYVDNQAHPIVANSDLWYRFDYTLSSSGQPQMTTLTILYGYKSGVAFEIYEPMDMNAYTDKGLSPVVGRGVPALVACSTGWCIGDDLVWTGAFGGSGTYYVRIINPTAFDTTFLLTIQGKGVNISERILVTSVTTTSTKIDDPTKAVVLDGTKQTIPANGAFWYRFDYSADDVKTINLLYGNKSGLQFQVYAPEIMNNWWNNDPIGVGAPVMLACSTGWCKGDDLAWIGAFGASGTYYVRVINNTAYDMPAVLTIQ